MKRRHHFLSFLLVTMAPMVHAAESADHPDCSGIERWPTRMAHTQLKNAGLLDGEQIDFAKTKTVRLASEKTGPNAYRQIHRVTFSRRDGSEIEVITSNIASREECSMSDVEVYVVAKRL
jgi:hypothetical protein